MSFQKSDYAALLERVRSAADGDEYREFHKKLIPGAADIIGVRLPVLRKFAAEIKKADWRGFLNCAEDSTHEELMLQAIVIAKAKCDIDERMGHLSAFVPKIKNWAVCDTVCTDLKVREDELEKMFAFLIPYAKSSEEFEIRFAVVIMMKSFLRDEYIDEVLRVFAEISHEGYYVKMGVAWGLAESFLNFREKTLAVLEGGTLDDFTQNKAIQKIKESFRISKEDKDYASTLKRNTRSRRND